MENILNKSVCLNIFWLSVGVALQWGGIMDLWLAGEKGSQETGLWGYSSVLLLAPISFYFICQDTSKHPNPSAVMASSS